MKGLKTLVARLPWGMRKLIAFVALHGSLGLIRSKPHFAGVYPSFDKAPVTGASDMSFLTRTADINVNRLKRDEANGLPLLGHSHQLMPLAVAMLANRRPVRILDFGGAAGADFRNLTSAIFDQSELHYHIVDLPDVCAVGRRRWQSDGRISFSEQMPEAGAQFDLIYSSWAVLYVPEPLSVLDQFAGYGARAILLINVPVTAKAAFVRVQLNHGIPSWVLSLSDIERIMRQRGYRLAFHVAGDVDHNVDNYPPEYRVANMANLLFLKS